MLKIGKRLYTIAHQYARLRMFQAHEVRITFKITNTVYDLTKEPTVMNMKIWKLDLWTLMCHISIIWRWTNQSMLKTKIKQNDPQPAYSLHILDKNHEYGLFTATINFRTNIFYSQSHCYCKNSYQNEMQVKKEPNATTYLCPSKYVTP